MGYFKAGACRPAPVSMTSVDTQATRTKRGSRRTKPWTGRRLDRTKPWRSQRKIVPWSLSRNIPLPTAAAQSGSDRRCQVQANSSA
jgi:hypothetical protein